MGKNPADIFNDCCERMLRGESLESCLSAYPQHAEKLEPLLRAAATVRDGAACIQPRPEFQAQARMRLEGAFMYAVKHPRVEKKTGFNWTRSWALATTTILVLIVAAAGTTAAASQSLPDQPLYPVKMATEQAMLTFTLSDSGKAKINTDLAERRAEEIAQIAMQEDDKPTQVAAAEIAAVTERMNTHLQNAEDYAAAAKPRTTTLRTVSPAQTTPAPTVTSLIPKVTPTPTSTPSPTIASTTTAPFATSPPVSFATSTGKTDAANAKSSDFQIYLQQSAPRSISALEQALVKAPVKSRPALEQALDQAKKKYAQALERMKQLDNGDGQDNSGPTSMLTDEPATPVPTVTPPAPPKPGIVLSGAKGESDR
jgi:hypothetical protein